MTPKRQKKKQVMMMSMVSLVGVTGVHTAVDTGRVVHCTYSVCHTFKCKELDEVHFLLCVLCP